jgi:hypothetical protein
MEPMLATPALVSLLAGLAIGLVVWRVVRGRGNAGSDALMHASDEMLPGLLAPAGFAMRVFLTYLVLTFGGNLWPSNTMQDGV